MFGLNTFALLCLLLILSSVKYLSNTNSKKQSKTLKVILTIMLLINIVRFLVDPSNIPVEFSTISYFVVPVIVIFNFKRLEIWAVYSAILAGSIYYTVMIASGGDIYNAYPHMNIYTSLFNHGSLLLYGLFKIKTITLDKTERYKLIMGLLLVLLWVLYFSTQINMTNRIFIYELLFATHIFSNFNSYLWVILPAYYVLITYIVFKSTKILFYVNDLLYNKNHTQKSIKQEYHIQKKLDNCTEPQKLDISVKIN